MKICNDLGKVVAIPLDHESMDAGVFEVEFDASGLASGMYLYAFSAQSVDNPAQVYEITRRMLLIK